MDAWPRPSDAGTGGAGARRSTPREGPYDLISDRRAVEATAAEAVVLTVHRPDQLDRIQDKIDGLRTDDTARR
ncbi:hypothetical protein [Streptomyces sp. NPDC058247]|uniref:hypothetical protein n=1 Tax=Streptomyces sp. NPDC058247 TaxID=3346401 RepID=UPI0036E4C365